MINWHPVPPQIEKQNNMEKDLKLGDFLVYIKY